MEEIYKEILDLIYYFVCTKPAKGFEISYLETSSRLFDFYKEALVICDEVSEESKEEAKNKLEEILFKIKKIV